MSFLAHPQKFRSIATKTEEKSMFLCYNNDCYKISPSLFPNNANEIKPVTFPYAIIFIYLSVLVSHLNKQD